MVDEQPGRGEDIKGGGDVAGIAGQLGDFSCVDLRSGGAWRPAGATGSGSRHSFGVWTTHTFGSGRPRLRAIAGQVAVRRRGRLANHGQVGVKVEQGQLPPLQRTERAGWPLSLGGALSLGVRGRWKRMLAKNSCWPYWLAPEGRRPGRVLGASAPVRGIAGTPALADTVFRRQYWQSPTGSGSATTGNPAAPVVSPIHTPGQAVPARPG